MRTIHTIGHSTHSCEELIALLRSYGIELLSDVRRFPGSRRHPQFSSSALARALDRVGIGYVHEEALGGRRPAHPDSPNVAWRNRGFRGYADYMASAAFGQALERLIQAASSRSTALLCAEAVPWRCHRNLIADALVVRGIDVRHILSTSRADAHVLNPNARVNSSGTLTYPADASRDLQLGLMD